jgi:hypothetical protein
MSIAIMQPYIFPYLSYWQLLQAADHFVFFDDVQFKSRSFMKRNKILLNGKVHQFSIPVKNTSREALINEVELHPQKFSKWRDKFLTTLQHAYTSADYFENAYSVVNDSLQRPHERISPLLCTSIKSVADYLGLKPAFHNSSSIDYERKGSGQDKILSICHQLGQNVYINPIGGLDYYDNQRFKDEGVELFFIQSEFRPYSQFDLSFQSHLSIIDMMMFLSPNEIRTRLTEYELIKNDKGSS